MTKPAPIVAELGRPETPEETAARKAESSRNYRSSQTMRNLVAALLVTLGMVAIIFLIVPRGEPESTPSVDLEEIAKNASTAVGGPVVVPDLGDFWRVNAASLDASGTTVWNITLAPASDEERGFIKIAQAFDSEASWAPQMLNGFAATGTEQIDGRSWDVYDIGERGEANVTYALGTQAGSDYVLLYGSRSADSTAELAASLSTQLTTIEEAG